MPGSKPEFTVRQEVFIHAPADIVFAFFAQPEKFSLWFGAGSSLEARKGGVVRVNFPDGSSAIGEVTDIDPPRSIIFTWGYPRENSPLPPGASTVEITLSGEPLGTRVTLLHRLPSDATAREHAGGWVYHMSRLATIAARAHFAGPGLAAIEHWFAAWSADGEECEKLLRAAVTEDVTFRDDAATAFNRAELQDHIERCHKFMKGVKLVRKSPVYQCGDQATCSAIMEAAGKEFGPTRLVFALAQDGRIKQATGFFETAVPGVTTGSAIGG